MILYGSVIIFAVYLTSTLVCANITLKAKFMGHMKVIGDSYSVYALSRFHCLAVCNKNTSCDAITYNDHVKKCRLFRRCVPLHPIGQNSHYWFFAKRPPITDGGYIYEEQSDSCLKIVNQQMDFKSAEKSCLEDRGYLAVLNTPKLKELAVNLLQLAGGLDAWINPPFDHYERHARNNKNGVRRKRQILAEDVAPQIKDCWLLQNDTLVKLSSCQSDRRPSICQLPTY